MRSAGEVEEAVMAQIRGIQRSPEVVTQVWREISKLKDKATADMDKVEAEVSVALTRIELVWDQLFPLEQHRIVNLLVDRIVVSPNELLVK